MRDPLVYVVAEAVNAAHGVDDVYFQDLAHRRGLAADIGHVVVARITLVAHVPEDRREAVLLGSAYHVLVPLYAALLVEVQVRPAQFRGTDIRAELADDNRVALVHVVRFHLGELFLGVADARELGIYATAPCVVTRVALGLAGFLVVTVVVLRHNGFARAPVLLAGHERVLVRVVVMHFEHQVAADLVLRECAHRGARDGLVDVGVETLDDQRACGVVAARGAHCVNKSLVVVHQRADVLRSPAVDIWAGLVRTRKN